VIASCSAAIKYYNLVKLVDVLPGKVSWCVTR